MFYKLNTKNFKSKLKQLVFASDHELFAQPNTYPRGKKQDFIYFIDKVWSTTEEVKYYWSGMKYLNPEVLLFPPCTYRVKPIALVYFTKISQIDGVKEIFKISIKLVPFN